MPAQGRKNLKAGRQASMALAQLFISHTSKTNVEIEEELGVGTFGPSGRRSGDLWARYVAGRQTMRMGARQRYYDLGKMLGLLPMPGLDGRPLTELQRDCGQGLKRSDGNVQDHVMSKIEAVKKIEKLEVRAVVALQALRDSLLESARLGVFFHLPGHDDPTCDPLLTGIDLLVNDLGRMAMSYLHPEAELR